MNSVAAKLGAEEWQSYTTICRLCMQRDGYMLGIFNHIQGKEKSISKKITDCTALEITSGDGLPNSICHRCLYKIEFCLEFRQQCFISDATLRQINGLAKNPDEIVLPQFPQEPVSEVVMVVDPNSLDYDSDFDPDANNASNTNAGHLPPVAVVEQAHSDIETNDFEFKNVSMCKYCDRAFVDKTECALHESGSHDPVAPYRCQPCDMNFADRLQYSAHLKSVHQNDKPYNCPECERTFARRSDLRKHTVVHTGIKPFTCHICYKSFSRNTNLSKHIRIHNGQKPFVCHTCPRTFMSKMELTRHSVQHSGVKPFKCNYCHMSFMRKDKLTRHQKRHFPQERNKMEDKTQELRQMRENLPSEYGYNNNDDDQGANKESKEVKDEWPSTENMVIDIDPFGNQHETTTSDLHNDETADEKHQSANDKGDIGENDCLRGENDLLSSVQNHTGEENVSKNDFSEAEENDFLKETDFPPPLEEIMPPNLEPNLEPSELPLPSVPEHITGDSFLLAPPIVDPSDTCPTLTPQVPIKPIKKHPCTMCTKKFMTANGLATHMGLHTGERPFRCSQCTKSFLRKRELERHMSTHTGMKPFKCPHCDKRFGRKDKMVRHARTHDLMISSNKDHNCFICGQTFNRKDGLAHHMKSHVKDEDETAMYVGQLPTQIQ